jgi:CheY-like chemotaxis protein
MEAIGTLAGGIAHDFNNMLGVIIGCSELAMDNIPELHVAKADMEKVLEAGLHAKSLIKQMLTFSRQEESELKPLIIPPLIKEAVKFLRATLPSTVEIRISIDTQDSAVLADPTQVQQIMMNLCTNSAQAMEPDGGVLEIRLSDEDLNSQTLSRFPGLKPGPYLNLTVGDTGSGIPEDIIHRIFDPFFTTKSVGEGTGLGLSVVHGIVKKHGGAVYADSPPGKGALFQVLLPRLEHPAIQVVPETISKLPRGKERILLVDDEVILTDILQRILSGLGYQIQAFVSSVKAFKSFKENPDRFDLALIDHTMPQMTGIELIVKIKQRRPDLPVILCSGLNEKLLEKDAGQIGVERLLVKPLSRADLAFAIRKVIDEKG